MGLVAQSYGLRHGNASSATPESRKKHPLRFAACRYSSFRIRFYACRPLLKWTRFEDMRFNSILHSILPYVNPQTYSSRDRSYWHAPGMIRPSSDLDHQGTSRNLSTPDTLAWS